MAVPASPVADGEAAEAKVGVAPADARRAGRRRSRLNSRRSHRLRGAYKDNEGGDDDGDTTASTASDLDRAANQGPGPGIKKQTKAGARITRIVVHPACLICGGDQGHQPPQLEFVLLLLDMFVFLIWSQAVAWDTYPCGHQHPGILLLLGAIAGCA
ncbi:uncharacterized protein LOC119322692 isoform X2 [Triticum dicoccoides]|uniref:uncharacterized protein LOC119322692 isoform X2 n=1 Tax=Triticum dicoccoides TaxID=85692 RepID=UPI00189107C5|nr:uncharacterized protein LOC119322692 isoform X2 [Triticum dicoccoides]XP_044413255.1 uncharacterized protein LOC123137531 isoform X2 [Triticum aestivum]